eukprot:jgi/Chrzof1/428/Cz01g15160.t1
MALSGRLLQTSLRLLAPLTSQQFHITAKVVQAGLNNCAPGASAWPCTTFTIGQQATALCRDSRLYVTRTSYDEEVDDINELFTEARDEIEMAREDADTVYFNESTETARKIVAELLLKWQKLLSTLPEEDRSKLQRAMGLKIEQLKAELKGLEELHA